jgi:hypothetical protein
LCLLTKGQKSESTTFQERLEEKIKYWIISCTTLYLTR